MARSSLALLFVCLLTPAGAAADAPVHVYLQPLPAGFGDVTLTIASLAAIGADGAEHPFDLRRRALTPGETARQRLLASGTLPDGRYTGLAIRLASATRNNTPLQVPDAPLRVDLSFSTARGQGPLVWLTMTGQPPWSDFDALFSASIPGLPLPDHAGLVTSAAANTVTVFDRDSAQAVAVIATCGGPSGLALDQRRRRAFVACSRDDEIQAIDLATGEVVERSRTSPGDRPLDLALTGDGLVLLSANSGSNSLTVFDAPSLTRQERIAVDSGPGAVAIDPAGRRAFVFNTLANSLTVVDLTTRSVAATLSTESAPLRGVFNRRGDRLYVIHDRSPYMTVLDPNQLTVVSRARLRGGIDAIAIDPVRHLVCVGGRSDPTVEFYDPNALMPLYSLRTGSGVSYMTTVPEDNALYLISPATRSLLVAGLAERRVLAEIEFADAPSRVVVMGER